MRYTVLWQAEDLQIPKQFGPCQLVWIAQAAWMYTILQMYKIPLSHSVAHLYFFSSPKQEVRE